jgi:hypothetical protein
MHMLPKSDIPILNGDPMMWPRWITGWKNLVHRAGIPDSHKISLLQQYLSPSVQQEIGIALYNPDMYHEVMATLKAYYGMPELVATRHLDTILQATPVIDGDRKGLTQLILNIRSTVAVLNASEADTELNSQVVINQIISKLPHSTQVKWISYTVKRCEQQTFYDLAVWLQPILHTERVLAM